MSALRLALAALLIVLPGSLASEAAAATFAELAAMLPDDANAVVVVNAAALYDSPLGRREGWRVNYASAFEATPLMLPPTALRGALAAEIDLNTLRPDWEAAVMELSTDPSSGDIARARGGKNDVIGGMQVTWLGKLGVLKFAPHRYGVLTPATRQDVAAWAADVKSARAGTLAPYLERVVAAEDAGDAHIMLAVELTHAFSEEGLRQSAAQSEAIAGVSPDVAVEILASVQGVRFSATATETLQGRVMLDFAEDATPLAAVAKPLILKVLAKAGATLPEFASWKAVPTAHTLAIEGELTADGLRRFLSLLAIDAGAVAPPEAEQATSTTVSLDAEKKAMITASQRYYRGVGKYVADIDRLGRAASLDQAVMWIDNYARRVEALPTRNVDPELVQYGNYVAQTFRSITDQASGLAEQYDAASTPVVTNYRIGLLPTARTVNYGGDFQRQYAPYGYADIDPQATAEQMQKSEEQISQAVAQAQTSLKQLLADQETVGKNLSEKYGVKF